MGRWALRRYIERLALASLPLWTGVACDPRATPADMQPLDLRAPDVADLGCPAANSGCTWLAYVDGGTPSETIAYWTPDGGADPCVPCGFAHQAGLFCGQCQVVANSCGTAYFCSALDCTLSCEPGAGSGRRPAGLAPAALVARERLADRLAAMAHLEAASVPAFAHLGAELAAHGAPERLIAGARRARLDEERHADVVAAVARAAGARALTLDVAPSPIRSLAELALENAVEGCVRETAGAILATRDARLWPAHARAFAAIAADERRHASLAWAIDAWAAPRLSPAERHRVADARAAAVRELFGVAA